jgi:hypothetical protein
MIHNAKDLSPDQRVAIESLLGQSLSEQDDVSIRKLGSVRQLAPERRQEILDDLDRYFARIDAKRQPVSEEEADTIVNEALRSARPDYRPIR